MEESVAKARRRPAKRSAKKATRSVGLKVKKTRTAKQKSKAKSKPKAAHRPTKPADAGSVPTTITAVLGTIQDNEPKA
jgi:hypothetical protein